jgi:aminoglycoside/choline kinase family phosphotransferase
MHNDHSGDARTAALHAFVTATLSRARFRVAPASSDASFRRYFRITLEEPVALARGAATLIVMDAPPPRENCRPFVRVAGLLAAAGVHAPQVLAEDLDQGFLLLSDLGTTMYLDALDASSAHALYLDAIDALVRWQLATRAGELPPYDEETLRFELDLFPEWYIARHLGRAPSAQEQATLEAVFRSVLANNLAQPQLFVHRDYHSRNLMVCDPNPGVLDFQDAVVGPITYDLVSLLRDAYVDWEEAQQLDWTIRYWERARAAGLPVAADFADFWRDFEWMGVQRQLKVLGIFARLQHRDGKDVYLQHMPRVMRYLRNASGRYVELAPLARLLDTLEERPAAVGYTF